MKERTGPDGRTRRTPGGSETHLDAWGRTLADMEAIAEDLRDDGREVVAIQAGDTAPEGRDVGGDRFGLSHVIPANKAEPFATAFEAVVDPEYRVYRQDVDAQVFILTRIDDAESDVSILLAGTFEKRFEGGLVRAAADAGAMYTHVRTLDGTHLGTFEHEDWKLFFPDADEYL